jgi:hypothetical protein
MSGRRRSLRRRPLNEFAQRSPLHALVAGLIRFALLAAVAVVAYFVIMDVLVPQMTDGLINEFRDQTR